jgi:hypothetical protein
VLDGTVYLIKVFNHQSKISNNYAICQNKVQIFPQGTIEAIINLLRTMTIKFLKPMKLGVVVESWLRQDVLGLECTAATCLYFLCTRFR